MGKMFPMIKLTFGALLLLAVTDIGEAKQRNIHIHLYGVQMWNPSTGSYPREGGSDYSDDSEEEDKEADEEKEKEDEEEDTEEDADEDAKKEGSDEKSKESSEEEPKEEEAGDDYSNGRFGTGFAARGFGNGGMQRPAESGNDYSIVSNGFEWTGRTGDRRQKESGNDYSIRGDYSAGNGFGAMTNMNGNMNFNNNNNNNNRESGQDYSAMPGGRGWSFRRMG